MAIALAALSGILLFFSFPPWGSGALAWLALVPLLHAVFGCKDAREASDLAAVAGLVFYTVSLHWLTKVFGAFAFAFWCLFAVWLALPVAAAWTLWRSDLLPKGVPPTARLVLAAAVWVGVEYFRSEVWSLRCSWLALGYSQTASPAFLQTASVIGAYGLSGLIFLFNAAAAWAINRREGVPLAALAALLAVLSILGGRRISVWTESGRPARAALVQSEAFDLETLTTMSAGPAAKDADLIVWPEYGFDVPPGKDDDYRRLIGRRLERSDAVVVAAGAIIREEIQGRGGIENFAWALAPGGKLLGRYDKASPIPFVEKRLAPNPDPRPIDTPLGRLGVQICYDLDFESGARRMAKLGAELLAVPNMDPIDWKDWQHRQHSAMAPMRAAESGLWIARAASSGISQLIDPLGRVRASLETGRSGVLTGEVRLARGRTLYVRGGWLVNWLALAAAAAVLCAWALRCRTVTVSE